MKKISILAAAAFGLAAIYAMQPSIAQDGWTTILDGKSLDGWDQLGGSELARRRRRRRRRSR